MNRPYKVKQCCLVTGVESTIFIDEEPTHYIDIGITKDKLYLVISSNTKEDSEIWIRARDFSNELVPKKLVSRVADVKAHIDHLRNFFVMITTLGSKTKNYRIATLQDENLHDSNDKWEDLLPFEHSKDLVISEFDGFKDFIAIYAKREGIPEICV